MAELKMPEINNVIIAGNLTKDPVTRQTTSGTPVVNFCIAANRKYRDGHSEWQEEVCYVGVVAWNKLAESCSESLRKGAAVLIDGELQSRSWRAEDGSSRTSVEIKARRIQFLSRRGAAESGGCDDAATDLVGFEKEFAEDEGIALIGRRAEGRDPSAQR